MRFLSIHCRCALILFLNPFAFPALLLAAAGPAHAQAKPYEPATVTYERPYDADLTLKNLIDSLHRAIAEKNLKLLDAALSPDFIAVDCSPDPTKPCGLPVKTAARLTAKLPAPARLRAALCCRDIAPGHITKAMREEAVLGFVGAALEEESIGTHPDLPGLACLPAWPLFDRAKASAIAAAADVEPGNLRVTMHEIALLELPAAGATESARLPPGRIAPVVSDLPDSLADGWTAIALPQGGTGYTDQLGLNEIAPGGLCFGKNAKGGWDIALTIQRRS